MNETRQHEVAERIVDAARYLHPVIPRSDQHHTRRARIFTDPRCNVRCRFCYYLDNHAEAWPGWLIRRQIDLAAEAGMLDIDFSGGESSMRGDFFDLVEHASRYGFRSIGTLTNGWRFADEDFMARAVEAGLTEVLFSVHGYDEQNHDYLTQVRGSHHRLRRAIELAHHHGLTVRTNTTVTAANYQRLEEHAHAIRDVVRPCNANFILFNEFSQAGRIADQLGVRYSDACPHVRAAVDVLKDAVPYVNVRYVPFCFMSGYEAHVTTYSQKIYDPFEWSQRLLALFRRDMLEQPDRYGPHLLSVLREQALDVRHEPGCIPADVADRAFVALNRRNYVKAESCTQCRFHHICDGLEQAYSQCHGVVELKPVPGERITDPLEFRRHFYDGYESYLVPPQRPVRRARPHIDVHAAAGAIGTASVIIPTYNRSPVLRRCLEALCGQPINADLEVVVVDDGSADDTERVVAAFEGRLPVHFLRQTHAGPAAARNLGIRQARGELIVIINDDTIAGAGFLAGHLSCHRLFGPNDRVAVLGARCFAPQTARRVMNFLFEGTPLYTPLHEEERGWRDGKRFITFSLSALRQSFYRYGFFDEDFPTALVEDVELGWRWGTAGCRVFFEPDIRATHDHLMTVDGWDDHITRLYTNRAIMFERHPQARPRGYYMDVTPQEMETFVRCGREFMERFRSDLKAVEGLVVDDLAGRTFMGRRIAGPEDFLALVQQIASDYKLYRSFAHCLQHAATRQEHRGEAVA
jgi:GT2 family glycosyltransferase/pyruvate-formate lyase-activating enzyme